MAGNIPVALQLVGTPGAAPRALGSVGSFPLWEWLQAGAAQDFPSVSLPVVTLGMLAVLAGLFLLQEQRVPAIPSQGWILNWDFPCNLGYLGVFLRVRLAGLKTWKFCGSFGGS